MSPPRPPFGSAHEAGVYGEGLAAQALRQHGYKILAHNWRCMAGEVDIIAMQGDMLVFVEVKLRSSEKYGTAIEAVTDKKRNTLYQIALSYVDSHEIRDTNWRIDAIAIRLTPTYKVHSIQIYEDIVRAYE